MTERFDANAVAFLAQQLEHLKPQDIETLYAPSRALEFIPVNMNIDVGAENYAYVVSDVVGFDATGGYISNGGQDYRNADVTREKTVSNIYTIGHMYGFTTEDMQRGRMAAFDLVSKRRMTAMDFLRRLIDFKAAFGDADKGMKGLLTDSNVEILQAAAAAGGANSPEWFTSGGELDDKTQLEILADLNNLVSRPFIISNGAHMVNTVLIDIENYSFLNRMPLSNDGNNSDSILSAFQKINPGVSVQAWAQLATADAAGTGPRAVAFEKNANNLEFIMPMAPTEGELLHKGHHYWENVFTARVGGTVIYRPGSIAYMDGF